MRRRCLIVDDSDAFLSSAAALLDTQGMTVVGCACSGAEALRMAADTNPDVALVDVELGEEDGIALARHLTVENADLAVVLVSAHPLGDVAELVAEAGAAGYLAKTALSAHAIEVICRRRGR